MTEPNEREPRRGERRPLEGVRIIPAEEAQAAIEAGAAAGRRGDDELRFGDVPPAPSGPRPPHRFPLPSSVDPAEVPHPPVAAPVRAEERAGGVRATRPVDADSAHDLRLWSDRQPGRTRARSLRRAGESPDAPETPEVGADRSDLATSETPPVLGQAPSFDPPASLPGPEVAVLPGPEVAWQQSSTPAVTPGAAVTPRVVPSASYGSTRWDAARGWVTEEVHEGPRAEDGSDEPTAVVPVVDDDVAPPAEDWQPLAPAWQPPTPGWEPPPLAGWQRPTGTGLAPAAGSSSPAVQSGGGQVGGGSREQAREEPAAPSDIPMTVSPTGWRPPQAWAAAAGPDPAPRTGPAAHLDPAAQLDPAAGAGPAPGPGPTADDEPGYSDAGSPAGVEASRAEPSQYSASGPEPPNEPRSLDALPDEGITVTGGFGTDLPHWTDPPTGEVPRMRPEDPDPDDLDAWQALGTTGARWRDEGDWDDVEGLEDLGSDETRVGALDTSRAEHSDLYSFDEDFERLDEERTGSHRAATAAGAPARSEPSASEAASAWSSSATDADDPDFEAVPERISTRVRTDERPEPRGPSRGSGPRDPGGAAPGGRDLPAAIGVGIGLVVILAIADVVGPKGLLVFAAAVLLACAAEAYSMVQRRGFKPATLLGLVATVGVSLAAYWRGPEALALVTAVTVVATMLWYLVGVVDARPVANISVSLMTYLWIGVLGSFAALLLRAPHGRGLFIGAILPTVAADVVAYFAGQRIGSRPLAPQASPGKTVEGALAGGLAAIIVGLIVGRALAPWGGLAHGLILGLVVAVLAPLGDLFESMVKRDLSIKDSGSILPGHGGLLDRFDSLLLILPAAYYLATLLNIPL